MSKPKIVFALASAGMGHVTRDVPIIKRLEQDYEVHIFCSGQANKWISQFFKNVHQNHAIKAAGVGGKISITLVVFRAFAELPKSLFYIFRIFLFILINRPKAIISDFEAHSIYAGYIFRKIFRIKIPIISCDHWTNLRFSECPIKLSTEDQKSLKKWQGSIKMVAPFADHYLVHGTWETKLSEPRAKYVPTPVRDSFLNANKDISSSGPIVVSMGHLAPATLTKTLESSKLKFIIYGSKNPRVENNITYKEFNEDEFIKSLQSSPFVIVSANSSAIDALAVGKPLLYCPTQGQFEQKYCGLMFEYIGVAKLVDELDANVIDEFYRNISIYQSKISKLNIFNNDELVMEIKKIIKN